MESRAKTGVHIKVGVFQARGGYHEPQLVIEMSRAVSDRRVLAELHRLAAEAELATPAAEMWSFEIELIADPRVASGRLYVLLHESRSNAEASRAHALLCQLAGMS